jgi:hypothetical protein
MTDQTQAPFLEAALDGVAAADLSDFVVEIGNHTGFGIAAFDEPMTNAARDVDSLYRLRASVLSRFDSSDANWFLLSTLDLTASDVQWLDREVPDRARAIKLLRTLIDGAPSRTLISVQWDLASRDRILDLLMEDVAGSARQLISIIASGDFPIDRLLDVGKAVLPFLGSEERAKLISDLLQRALVEADLDDQRVSSLLKDEGGSIAPRQLVHAATSSSATTQWVAKNLALLAGAPDNTRRSASSAVDELSQRLIRRPSENLGEAGFRAWAELIREAGKHFPDVQLRAALPALSFALSRKDMPVSAVIGAAFPVAYAELLRSTGEEDFRRLPALLALPLSFF